MMLPRSDLQLIKTTGDTKSQIDTLKQKKKRQQPVNIM